jgi:hypothetical protein
MQAAHMTFEEEVIKLRSECKYLRQENARFKNSNDKLTIKVTKLAQENLELRKSNSLLKQKQLLLVEKQQLLEKEIETLKLIVEELQKMVFGKKKGTDDKHTDFPEGTTTSGTSGNDTNNNTVKKRKSANRANDSYRRNAPKESEVTDRVEHALTTCPDCGTLLIELKQIIRYREDLVNLIDLAKLLKKVEKHIIGSGYCPTCKKRKTAMDISPQVSILGDNIKKFVCYLSVIMRLSFEQVRCFLKDTADFHLSDGEITACLDQQAEILKPEKERLLHKVRGAPGRHYDETGWKVQTGGQGNYCWITRPTIGEETVFLMGRSRGKGVALELQGAVDTQVGITDDYAAYDNLFTKHQLCMAHPKRKLKDLHEAKTLSATSRTSCTQSYQVFSNLYKDLESTLKTDYQQEVWLKKREEYIKRIKEIAIITNKDPQKLKAIKKSLKANAEQYFTCLLQPGIPADNNKAERGLRHIVLKRKISYGSKSQKGATTMSILCSTLLSAWWNKPDNFFTAYNQMLAV